MIIIIKKSVLKISFFVLTIIVIVATFLAVCSNFLSPRIKFTVENSFSFNKPYGITIQDLFSSQPSYGIYESCYLNKESTFKYKTFTSPENKISFEYPEVIELGKLVFSGADILYHISLVNKSNKAQGFIQVWKLDEDLLTFLENSRKMSNLNYLSFSQKEIQKDKLNGLLWEYTLATSHEPIKGLEAFFKKDEKMYRISYFCPQKQFNKSQEKIFWDIVDSFSVLQ